MREVEDKWTMNRTNQSVEKWLFWSYICALSYYTGSKFVAYKWETNKDKFERFPARI